MGQQINQEQAIRHIIQMVLNSTNPISTLYEQLIGFEGGIEDKSIWAIIDEIKDGKNNVDIIRTVLMSGAQTPESACRMLYLYRFDMELLNLTMQAYDESMEFRMTILAMLEQYQPLKAKLVQHQYDLGLYQMAVNC